LSRPEKKGTAFIHRETHYNRSEEMSEADLAMSEIIIANRRYGPTDTVCLNFVPKFTGFDNRDSGHAV
jgi:replicative DNA helicase